MLYLEGLTGFTLVEHLVRNYLKSISININDYVLRIFTMLTQEGHSHREHTKLGSCLRENFVNPCRRHSLCFFMSFTKSVFISLVLPLMMAPTRFRFVARKKKKNYGQPLNAIRRLK